MSLVRLEGDDDFKGPRCLQRGWRGRSTPPSVVEINLSAPTLCVTLLGGGVSVERRPDTNSSFLCAGAVVEIEISQGTNDKQGETRRDKKWTHNVQARSDKHDNGHQWTHCLKYRLATVGSFVLPPGRNSLEVFGVFAIPTPLSRSHTRVVGSSE